MAALTASGFAPKGRAQQVEGVWDCGSHPGFGCPECLNVVDLIYEEREAFDLRSVVEVLTMVVW